MELQVYTNQLKSQHKIEPWDSYLLPEAFIVDDSSLSGQVYDTVHATVEKYGLCVVRSSAAVRNTLKPSGADDPSEAGYVDPVMKALIKAFGQANRTQSEAKGHEHKLINSSTKSDGAAAGTPCDLPPHTDGTFLEGAPPSFVLLQYLVEPDLGGYLTFVDMANIISILFKSSDRAHDLFATLCQPGAFEFQKKYPDGKIMSGSTDCIFTSPDLKTVNAVGVRMRLDDGFRANSLAKEAYEMVKQIAVGPKQQLLFMPRQYDVVIIDNWRVMHGRDQYFSLVSRTHRRAWVDVAPPYLPRLSGVRPIDIFRSYNVEGFNVNSSSLVPSPVVPVSKDNTLQDKLRELYKNRFDKVHKLNFSARPKSPEDLPNLIVYAKEGMQAAITGFGRLEHVTGSWISSMSLPTQLVIQPHLTVDLTVAEASKEKPFGLPFQSLIELVVEGHLYLNIRDYDSQEPKNFSGYLNEWGERNLGELLKQAYSRIYIGSALRKSVFDASLAWSGSSRQYETWYKEAQDALRPAYDCFAILDDKDPIVQSSLFRGERPSLAAVCWHWAFLNSVAHFLDAGFLSAEDENTQLGQEYLRVVDLGHGAKVVATDERCRKAATAWSGLARILRSAHLNFTAPITASFGTTYNMAEDEYKESLKFGFAPDGQIVARRSEEVNAFFYYASSEAQGIADPTLAASRDLPDGLCLRALRAHTFHEGIMDKLIKGLTKTKSKKCEMNDIYSELQNIYLNGRSQSVLGNLWHDYKKVKDEIVALHLQGLGNAIFADSGQDCFIPSQPWVSDLSSVQNSLRRPHAYRSLQRVYWQAKKN